MRDTFGTPYGRRMRRRVDQLVRVGSRRCAPRDPAAQRPVRVGRSASHLASPPRRCRATRRGERSKRGSRGPDVTALSRFPAEGPRGTGSTIRCGCSSAATGIDNDSGVASSRGATSLRRSMSAAPRCRLKLPIRSPWQGSSNSSTRSAMTGGARRIAQGVRRGRFRGGEWRGWPPRDRHRRRQGCEG